MRKLKEAKKRKQAPIIDWEQKRFDAFYGDIPASTIPNNAVSYLFNAIMFGDYVEARTGTRLWGTELPSPEEEDGEISSGGRPITPLPSIDGRDNYVASKVDDTITKTAGQDFTEDDILSWFLWPDGIRDLIIEFVDSDTVKTKSSAVHAASTEDDPAKLQRPMNARPKWHNESKKCFFLIGETVYWTDYTMSKFHQVPCLSDIPYNAKSTFDETKGSVYLFNYNGCYKIDATEEIIVMYKCNDPAQENKIEPVEETLIKKNGRRYLYSFSRIIGGVDRGHGGKLVKETGSNLVDPNNDYNDFKEVFWQSEPKSTTGDYFREVAGSTPTSRLDQFLAINDGQFNIAFTIGTRNVECDFTDDETWGDIANTIQTRLRAVFPENPEAECRYEEDNLRFVINEGTSAGNQASYTTTGSDGTDISLAAYLGMEDPLFGGTGEYLLKPSSHVVGEDSEDSLHLPDGFNQYTHYSVYCTEDVNNISTNPDFFAWNADVAVAKAFVCSIDAGGQIDATEGTFELTDVGSELVFQNGRTAIIRAVLSNTEARANYTGTAPAAPEGPKGCAIGGGRIMKAVHQNNDIARISGDKFQQSDVDKMFFWSDGSFSVVKRYISGDKVETYDTGDRTETAGTIDPDSRNFNDVISDKEVIYRAKRFPLRMRFWEGIRNFGLGAITPGYMFTAPINGKDLDYSQLPVDYEYIGGHHYQKYQRITTKDAIRHMAEFPDKLVLYCANSTRKVAINNSREVRTPEVGELIVVLSGASLIDPDTGIKDRGGVMDVGGGRQIVVTSEPAVRLFNGDGYSKDLAIDSEGKGFISKELAKLQMSLASAYDPKVGYLFWGSDEEATV